MIRHLAMFRLGSTAGPELERLHDAMEALRTVPAVRGLVHGRALGWQPGYDYAMSVDLEDHAAFEAYKASAEHLALVGVLKPLVAEAARLQLELPA